MSTLLFSFLIAFATESAEPVPVTRVPGGQADLGFVEIHGVAAGAFNPDHWATSTLHLVPDARRPLVAPRYGGVFRNIYAPSAVRTESGWRVFYGAWDGAHTGNDRIYSLPTADFVDFGARSLVIDHGPFVHVCNVNAFRNADGSWEMMCTALLEHGGLNKPVYFTSPDGETWNGRAEPADAATDDYITITGYDDFEGADINGMNVIMRDGDALHLYFNDFKQFGHVYHAVRAGGHTFAYTNPALEVRAMVNDVNRFDADGRAWYLMGLHRNRQHLLYSVSNDPAQFPPAQELFERVDADDEFIVAIGFVRDGNRVLGFLYGAGAVPGLNRNRLFATWLQKRVVFVPEDGEPIEAAAAMGPDRCLIPVSTESAIQGRFEVYAEDGATLLGHSDTVTLQEGQVWRLGE